MSSHTKPVEPSAARRAANTSDYVVDEPTRRFWPYACQCDDCDPLGPEAERVEVEAPIANSAWTTWTYRCTGCGMTLGFTEIEQ